MANKAPLVSCLCLTYARPQLLREAVWSFLQQGYPNKELIIINDHHEPIELDGEYPEIRLFNHPERFANLGQKRNYSAQVAKGEFLLVWDDDDLYLPWRIETTVRHLLAAPDRWAFKPTQAWTSTNNQGYGLAKNLFHSQLGIRRSAFFQLGGYTDMNSGQDLEFERRIPKERWLRYTAPVSELIYLYRWGNGVSHISGLGRDQPGKESAWEIIARRYQGHSGGLVQPGFDRPYWRDLLTAARTLPDVAPEQWRLLEARLAPHHDLGHPGNRVVE